MSMVPWLALSAAVFSMGAGAEDSSARKEMVESQIRERGVLDERVLAAMEKVPRHEFIPPELRRFAYGDGPLPIGHGQTISQPYIVALMSELLQLNRDSRVLEIGTGSGYQAAVLAELVADVYTIEIVAPLAHQAKETLERLGYQNVHTKVGDGYLGWPEASPFDAIIVTCAPDHVPQKLIEQVREGGRLVVPVGQYGDVQELYLLEKIGGTIRRKAVTAVRFVPMIHKTQ